MVRLICDFSFVCNYVEQFYSDEDRDAAELVNKCISPAVNDDPILVISCLTIEQARKAFPERPLILDSLFDICEKSDVEIEDRIDLLTKLAAIYEIEDESTYVLAEDSYIISSINNTSHNAISIKKALELLKESD